MIIPKISNPMSFNQIEAAAGLFNQLLESDGSGFDCFLNLKGFSVYQSFCESMEVKPCLLE